MPRRVLLVLSVAVAIGIAVYVDAWRKLEADFAEKEKTVIAPKIDEKSVAEIGYIFEMRRENKITKHEREIRWWVRIPSTNKRYSCLWENGHTGFAKDDAVKLIHKKWGQEDSDYYGFIVGPHGKQAGQSAVVWALDLDDLEYLRDE